MYDDVFYNLNKIDKMYDVADVKTGFNYWFWKLLNICISMFDYTNLPPLLPQREIELNLILTNHCVVFQGDENQLMTANTNVYGFDVYYNPTDAVYANPLLKYKKLNIGMNCEIIYNNNLKDNVSYIPSDGSLKSFIYRYSRMLADIESTINIYTVNSRLTSFPVASNDKVADSIKTFFRKVKQGKNAVISDDAIIQEFRNIDINKLNVKDGINDLLIARDKILEMFYRDVGVKFYNPKKAQVTEDEIEVNDQLLLISKEDMLKERKQGVERVNNMFGTSIDVKINDRFNVEFSQLNKKDGEEDVI
jgi:hypothetical protein